MKGNARKYLSLMLTASMVLGSFGTTAIAANTKTATYSSIKDVFGVTGTTTPAGITITTTQSALIKNTSNVGIANESGHTVISLDNVKADFTTQGAVAANIIDFDSANITVQATASTVNMAGGKIGSLTFSSAARSARAAGNSVTVSGGEVKTDITGASAVTVDGGTVTGKVEATESVEVKNGIVGSVETATATISGGTVNAVKASESVEVTGGTAKAVESPNVTVASGAKVEGVKNVENLKVESGATITGTIETAKDKDVVIDIDKDATATGTTITVPSGNTGSVSVKVPTGVTPPTEADNVEVVDPNTGETAVQKASVEYYENETATTPIETIEYAKDDAENPITNNMITLPAPETPTGKVVSWTYKLATGAEATTNVGDTVDVTTLEKPIKMVANYSTPTPPPTTEVKVTFEYYTGTTTGSAIVSFATASDAKFPAYTNAALNKTDVATPDNQTFEGWVVKGTTTPVSAVGDTITDTTKTYVSQFKVNGSTDPDPGPSETTKTITYKDGTTKPFVTPFDSATNKITLPTYQQVFGVAAPATFEGWEVSGVTYKEGAKVDFKEGMTVTAVHGEVPGADEVKVEITLGDGFKNVNLKVDAAGYVELPTFASVAGDFATGKVFQGWKVTFKDGTTKTVNEGDTVKYADVAKIEAVYTEASANQITVELYRINSDTTAQKTVAIDYTLDANGNKVFKAPANEFSYSGKTFDSWSTNFDKAYYYPGKDVTVPAAFTDTVKLYAYWTSKSSSSGGGGGGSSSSSTKYTVTASAGKGGSISPSGDVQVTKGNDKTFKITANEGYVISDVMVDGDSVGAVKSYTIKNIKNDMTIKAVFETTDGEPAEGEPENPSETPSEKGNFTDARGHWAESYINTVVEKGLFSGMTDTTFGPDVAMTRAMFVTVLGRMSNVDTTKYSSSKFSDVPADSWFGPYVNWAAQNGIVSGLTSTTFGPNDPITREQMAVVLVNYAKVASVVLPTVNDAMMFSDNSNISGWAKDAVATAQKAGLINGRTNGSFDPQGKATRAEVATVFVQLDSLSGGSKSANTDTAASADDAEATDTEITEE